MKYFALRMEKEDLDKLSELPWSDSSEMRRRRREMKKGMCDLCAMVDIETPAVGKCKNPDYSECNLCQDCIDEEDSCFETEEEDKNEKHID